MALTDAQRQTLAKKAANHSLEVEHLVKVATQGDVTDIPFLRALKAEHGWPDRALVGRRRVVPLGRWADAVCRFLESGHAGLIRLAGESPEAITFCIGLLEEIKTPESVSTLLAIGGPVIDRPAADVGLSVQLADGLNLLLSFKDGITLAPMVEKAVRDFLHRLLALELTEVQRASAVCALRGVGDKTTLTLISGLPPFRGSWKGLEQSAARQIKQRLRPSKGVPAPDKL